LHALPVIDDPGLPDGFFGLSDNGTVNWVPVDVIVRVVEGADSLGGGNWGKVVNLVREPDGVEIRGLVVVSKLFGNSFEDLSPETGLSVGVGEAVNALVVEGIAPELLEDGAILETSGQLSGSGDPGLNSNLVKSGLSTTHVHVSVKRNLEQVFGMVRVFKTFSVIKANIVGELSVVFVSDKGFGSATATVVDSGKAFVGGVDGIVLVNGGVSAVHFNDAVHVTNSHSELLNERAVLVAIGGVWKVIA
jgi:hypothetical protein